MISEGISQSNASFDNYKERITNFSNEFELGLFLYILRRSLIWIFLIMLLAGTSAALYLRYTPDTYEARAIVQVRKTNTAKVLAMSTFSEDENLYTDVEFMRSRLFLGKVIDRLPMEVSYFNRGQILTEEYYTHSFFKLTDLVVTNDAIRDIPVAIDLNVPNMVGVSYTVAGAPFKGAFGRDEPIRTPHFSARLQLNSHPVLSQQDDKVNLYLKINSRDRLLDMYVQRLSIKVLDPVARTIDVTCRDQNPWIAKDLSQSVVTTYIDEDVARQGKSAESVLGFIRDQKDTVFASLRDSEYELRNSQVENKVIDMNLMTPLYLERTAKMEDDLVDATLELELLRAMERNTDKPVEEMAAYDLLPPHRHQIRTVLGHHFPRAAGAGAAARRHGH
ncbi:MAG: hypothetical protein IPJ85_13755 [Flavobacteriales bacterium]|nr:hypothetical protein [Flavobacteriales bacterium]